MGLSLICVAMFVAIIPFQIGALNEPSLRLYQNAKGSWVPAAYAHSIAAEFFKAAGVLGIAGVLFLSFSAISNWLNRRHLRLSKHVGKQTRGDTSTNGEP